jgi:phosphoribosylformylglycinamidine cyclo-ligase
MVTYKQAGVDIDKGNLFVKRIKKIAPVIGGFSGLYPLDKKHYLSASSDGVGTKLKLAFLLNKHNTVGVDLVAMNVNDVICCGAKPLFFLDYFACSKLDLKVAEQIIKGINEGCCQADCILLGGETAEMPGFYHEGEYDLAGFTVGLVEKNKVIDGRKIKPGDLIIGLPSSGLHSNGFSLVRKIFSKKELIKYGEELLTPTKIYVKEILSAIRRQPSAISGIVNITGGGFYDNIPRILPKNCQAVIDKKSWQVPEIFRIIQDKGKIPEKEMFRIFNMGVGMVIIVDKFTLNRFGSGLISSRVHKLLKNSVIIGKIVSGKQEVKLI